MNAGNPKSPAQQSQVQQSDAERGRREASVRDDASQHERQQAGRAGRNDQEEEE